MGLKQALGAVKREARVWMLVWRDPRTPRAARWCLGAALAYLASPVDLVPDFIPVLGQLDDLLIVPGLIWLATRFIPGSIIEECRTKVRQQEESSDKSSPSIDVDS
ncbi:MAG: YkvA family protein [Candidatus Cryosericum sp.]